MNSQKGHTDRPPEQLQTEHSSGGSWAMVTLLSSVALVSILLLYGLIRINVIAAVAFAALLFPAGVRLIRGVVNRTRMKRRSSVSTPSPPVTALPESSPATRTEGEFSQGTSTHARPTNQGGSSGSPQGEQSSTHGDHPVAQQSNDNHVPSTDQNRKSAEERLLERLVMHLVEMAAEERTEKRLMEAKFHRQQAEDAVSALVGGVTAGDAESAASLDLLESLLNVNLKKDDEIRTPDRTVDTARPTSHLPHQGQATGTEGKSNILPFRSRKQDAWEI
jgi:hypothetical protein